MTQQDLSTAASQPNANSTTPNTLTPKSLIPPKSTPKATHIKKRKRDTSDDNASKRKKKEGLDGAEVPKESDSVAVNETPSGGTSTNAETTASTSDNTTSATDASTTTNSTNTTTPLVPSTYTPPPLPFKVSNTLTILSFGDDPNVPPPATIPLDNIYPKNYRAIRYYSDYADPTKKERAAYEVHITDAGKFSVTYQSDPTKSFQEDNPTKAWSVFVEHRNTTVGTNSKLSGPKQFGVTEDKVRRVLLSIIMRRPITDDEWTTIKSHHQRMPSSTKDKEKRDKRDERDDEDSDAKERRKRKRKRAQGASGNAANATTLQPAAPLIVPKKNHQINEPLTYACQQFYNPKHKEHYDERFAKHYLDLYFAGKKFSVRGHKDENQVAAGASQDEEAMVVDSPVVALDATTGDDAQSATNGTTAAANTQEDSPTSSQNGNAPPAAPPGAFCRVCLDTFERDPYSIECTVCPGKYFHTGCVSSEFTFANRDKVPWKCPAHACCHCGDDMEVISHCSMCPNSFCSLCEPMRMQEEEACCGFSLCKDCFAVHGALSRGSRT